MVNEYTILTSEFTQVLIEEVNKLLQDGWQCQGGVSTHTWKNSDGGIEVDLYQAMVREKKDDLQTHR